MEDNKNNTDEKKFGEIIGLRDEIGEIQEAIAEFEVGKKLNVAIIAGLFGGKTTLINEIKKLSLSRATKITFSEIVRNKDLAFNLLMRKDIKLAYKKLLLSAILSTMVETTFQSLFDLSLKKQYHRGKYI